MHAVTLIMVRISQNGHGSRKTIVRLLHLSPVHMVMGFCLRAGSYEPEIRFDVVRGSSETKLRGLPTFVERSSSLRSCGPKTREP